MHWGRKSLSKLLDEANNQRKTTVAFKDLFT